jgi:hypothetical protein
VGSVAERPVPRINHVLSHISEVGRRTDQYTEQHWMSIGAALEVEVDRPPYRRKVELGPPLSGTSLLALSLINHSLTIDAGPGHLRACRQKFVSSVMALIVVASVRSMVLAVIEWLAGRFP